MTDIFLSMTRKKLYDAIWEYSVMGVSKEFELNYPKLLESCKKSDIPVPPSGYWMKLAAQKEVSHLKQELQGDFEEIIRLIKKSNVHEINSTINRNEKNQVEQQNSKIQEKEDKSCNKFDDSKLIFLNQLEQNKVLNYVNRIQINENKRLHPKLISYKKSVSSWKKQKKQSENNYYSSYGQKREIPQFISEISNESFPRMLKILDAIFVAIEALGGKIYSDLSMKIRTDIVKIEFFEAKDKFKHELTKNEAKELVEYNDAKKAGHYAYKPRIKKYDYKFNGKLKIRFGERHYISDSKNEILENQLGIILITLYEKSEENRIKREKQELEQRIRQEKAKRAEEKRQAIQNEKELTQALVNQSEDYQIACQIRNFISAMVLQNKHKPEEEWISWANNKADWFDPTISMEDNLLGKRNHKLSKEEKELLKKFERRNWFD